MSSNPTAGEDRQRLLEAAGDPDLTPFDYIVIGSGAGGGPLAARLAESGQRVLVLEAGADPALPPDATAAAPGSGGSPGEIYEVPGYHGAATEAPHMCWSFSVRHYEDDARQRLDSKYDPAHDPAAHGQPGKGGILYPRSSGLGGCTGHFAMIVVRPNDSDWDDIAERTGDASWRASNMQGYFAKIEDCLYYKSYDGFLRKILFIYIWLMRAVRLFNPRWQLDGGGHGFKGWQKTSFIDPELILKIARGDRTFVRVLFDVFRFLWCGKGQLTALVGALLRLQLVQFLDPNFGVQRRDRSGRTAFIPVATDGQRRFSLRERLLDVAARYPDRLSLVAGVLARRLIFRNEAGVPRAVGVEVEQGLHLYEASPLHATAPANPPRLQLFARREIVVACGAFNTPQLLMLSGIGDAAHLQEMGVDGPRDAAGEVVAPVIDLPGVGRNLQDRYEVSVITETHEPFSTLNGVSFIPGDSNDPARQQWLKSGQGLYATNGGAVAFFLRTRQAQSEAPDLFIFGAPAAFRGYYWNWSKELLRPFKGAPTEQRNLWSWILLKAYTRSASGSVRLRSASARSQPEINFQSFAGAHAAEDLDAVCEAVEFVRRINAHVKVFGREIQPGGNRAGADLRAWIVNEAWGHHACGTCRMGSDRWQSNSQRLQDRGAVLDSQFRVHGVRALRVVDTSVFPKIPGYFIVTPTFMIGEKAADMLLADSTVYPRKLEAAEARAIRNRRARANLTSATGTSATADSQAERLPSDTVGLAFSGGGVRSATFCLGVLQALAKRGRLAHVDLISSVSGGGYIAAFLGRLFTRMSSSVANPVKRIQDILSSSASAEIWWLRAHARYITGAGRTDLETGAGTVWRNLLSVHVSVSLVIIAAALALCWIGAAADLPRPQLPLSGAWHDLRLSAWWWTPVAVLALGLLPAWIGFWLAPKPGSKASLSLGGLPLWLLALLGSIAIMTTTHGFVLGAGAIVVLLLSWVWQEAALWRVPAATEATARGTIARNRLTRGAGITLGLLAGTTLWVVLDTFADYIASAPQVPITLMGLVAASLPTLRALTMRLASSLGSKVKPAATSAATPRDDKTARIGQTIGQGTVAFALLGLLVFGLDVIAHWAFLKPHLGEAFLIAAIIASLAIGRATAFVNLSSLQSWYTARLARTYLGAANEARTGATGSSPLNDVDAAHPDDDVFFHDYHPENHGGPLHLINVCVNETVDVTSGRQLAEDKGLSMCLGPEGVSVGVRFHALWDSLQPQEQAVGERVVQSLEEPERIPHGVKSGLRALPMGPDPEAFHVLASRKSAVAAVESLRLSEWIAISGAAFSTGLGRRTTLPMALLLGLFNVRLGHWWNSHIDAGDRPGRYPPSLWRRLKAIPGALFRTQATILNEWRGYFVGPSQRLWYLTDGGHSENTGLYELIRRRVHFIVAVDSDSDPGYTFDDLGLLIRHVRLDFGANFQWIDPTSARRNGTHGWDAIRQAAGASDLPITLRQWLNPEALGDLGAVQRRGSFSAALARIDYDDRGRPSWLVILKSSLSTPPPLPLDVECYAKSNDAFPNQSTMDQFFNDDQWESYRMLGETLMGTVLRQPDDV